MKILLTGGNGFIGSHLRPRLAAAGHEVVTPELPSFDLRKASTIRDAVGWTKWDAVIHLAGMSHVGECEANKDLAHAVNVEGTRILVEALAEAAPESRLIFASSAQIYAAPSGLELTQGVVFDETRKVEPQNYYGKTKYEAEQIIRSAVSEGSFKATILWLFNYTHKTQSPNFFLPGVYQQLLARRNESEPVRITVGNIELYRDIGAVQDLVTALLAVIRHQGAPLEGFNVCSGRKRHLGRLISLLSALTDVPAKFVVDPSRMRPGEAVSIHGSHEKLTAATGWRPAVQTDEELISAFLEDS